MNLKESFRYQNFLTSMLNSATASIIHSEHCQTAEKKHNISKADPSKEDYEETVAPEQDFYGNDDVLRFIAFLIDQRDKLGRAISEAKHNIWLATDLDLDAAVECNKARQSAVIAMKRMLNNNRKNSVSMSGSALKFNVEGNQVPFQYEVETTYTDAYDRCAAKEQMRSLIAESDRISAEIDAAMTNTVVNFTPTLNVNDSFFDAMEEFGAELITH